MDTRQPTLSAAKLQQRARQAATMRARWRQLSEEERSRRRGALCVLCVTHGATGTPEYNIWDAMKQRCHNRRHRNYRHYGGRGITVCTRWCGPDGFENFMNDMGPRPPGMTLEREDNQRGYSPENCCWATREKQTRNRRVTVRMTFEEETLPLATWAERRGLSARTIRARLRRGASDADALSHTLRHHPTISVEERRYRRRAMAAVSQAVRSGQLVKSAHCSAPGCAQTRVQGHHHHGYDPEHWLDIVWLCAKHHYQGDTHT